MEMAKTCQSHGLEFTSDKQTLIILKIQTRISIEVNVVVIGGGGAVDIITRTLNVGKSGNLRIIGLLDMVVFERANTKLPIVNPVLEFEVFHESPIVVSVATGELSEMVQSALEEFLTREMGSA